jgi:curved DNA-binding protein
MNNDYYAILEVEKGATAAEIKKSYKKLARKYHPDLNQNNTEAENKFKELNEAYEVLGNSQKKQQYDMFGSAGGQQMDMSSMFNDMFANFGFNSSGGNFQREPDIDIQAELHISFEDAMMGTTKNITLMGENIEVIIPKGSLPGETLTIKGKGENYQGKTGDLVLHLQIQRSDVYEMNGLDLYKQVDIDLKTAILGGKINIDTFIKDVSLTIPKNTKFMQKFKLKGYGVDATEKYGQKGDMYIVVNIVMPEKYSKEFIKALEKL